MLQIKTLLENHSILQDKEKTYFLLIIEKLYAPKNQGSEFTEQIQDTDCDNVKT